jgi:signal transduction histidine kinase
LQTANVLILTDDSEFARLLCSCWRAERRPPSLTVVNSDVWQARDCQNHHLVVVGPVSADRLSRTLAAIPPATTVILCSPSDIQEIRKLRLRFPNLLHIALRDDWTQTLLLVADESLRRVAANRQAQQALVRAARSEREAILGRYMLDMKHSVNNALTSILGNAELLLLEPGQLSAQSLQQVRTVHQMSLRLHEIMQRFSTLSSEIREAEIASQAETEEASLNPSSRR